MFSGLQRFMEITIEEAKRNIHRSDEARAAYYKNISGNQWGERQNYDILIDSSVGIENCTKLLCDYVENLG